MQRFDFAFDKWFMPGLVLLGVTPMTAYADLSEAGLSVRFGFWKLETELSNITCFKVTEDYTWYKAIGARGSFVDRGLTFGTNAERGVCVKFAKPIPALVPGDIMPHPGLTMTLADIDGFVASLEAVGVSAPA